MNIKEKLNNTIKILNENNIENSNLKAKLVFSNLLKMKKEELLINDKKELKTSEIIEIDKAVEKLLNDIPIQYIIHNQEFMKLKFYVDKNVLIPQPDTEILVEKAIDYINNNKNNTFKILDLCTGSGCISISIAKLISDSIKLDIVSSDISKDALRVAEKNANIHSVSNKIKFINSNMFEKIEDNFDMIVSNPPYIETSVISTLSNEVQNEPHLALDGGNDGLKFYKIISEEAYKHLNKDGILILEIGYNQKEKVINLFEKTKKYNNIECVKDYSNNDRLIIAKKG